MSDTKDKSKLHHNHRKRMRDRFYAHGFDGYQPHEVLEQILFDAIPRVNTNPIGHELINRFGSVLAVLDAPAHELTEVDGIGPKSAEYIASIKSRLDRIITEQYREVEDFNPYNIAFLTDWYMRTANETSVGVAVIGKKRFFESFIVLENTADIDLDKLISDIERDLFGKSCHIVFKWSPKFERINFHEFRRQLEEININLVNVYSYRDLRATPYFPYKPKKLYITKEW